MTNATNTTIRPLGLALLAAAAVVLLSACQTTQTAPSGKLQASTAARPAVEDAKKACRRIEGVYEGVLPAADDSGIRTTLYLRAVGTYTMTQHFVSRSETFASSGTWSRSKIHPGTICLNSIDEQTPARILRIEPNALRFLDLEGNVIEGSLADFYVLKKAGCP